MSLLCRFVLGPAAAPSCTSPECLHSRCAPKRQATHQKGGPVQRGVRREKSEGRRDADSSHGRTGDNLTSIGQDPKPRAPKTGPPPSSEADNNTGLIDLDTLLADEDAVQQLRASLIAALSVQQEKVKQEGALPLCTDAIGLSSEADTSSPDDGLSRSSSNISGTESAVVPLIVIKKDKARLFLTGNPMVYGGAVDCVIARPPPGIGEPVLVVDASRRQLGWGVFNPHSMFRVRMFQQQAEVEIDPRVMLNVPALLQIRVRQAVELRRAMGLPSADTNVFRLINSEGDRLSGLVADVLGNTVVVQAGAAWVQRYRVDVEAAIRGATALSRIVWRPLWKILEEEGLQQPAAERDEEGKPGVEAAGTSSDTEGEDGGQSQDEETVEVRESGLRFLASPKGQKTGFYADQRDSRAFLAGLARAQAAAGSPPTLLDLCCYSGGFALAAAAAGASRVVGVDSSEPAVKLATANAQLNGLSSIASFIRADVSDFMKSAVAQGQQYDIVVLDPPKLAPDRRSLDRARVKYQRLNSLAMRLVRPGGLLMTCSCSGAMTQSNQFLETVLESAQEIRRQLTLLREAGAAADHVLNPAYQEGKYLTNITLRLM